MGEHVRKKRGRPPKVDCGARDTPATQCDLRRSRRRRNVKYVFDLDDYFDDDDVFEGDEDHRRKAKKLKLLLNLQTDAELQSKGSCNGSAPFAKNGGKPSKFRKFKNEIDEDVNDSDGEGDYDHNGAEDRERKPEPMYEGSTPETPIEAPSGLPLPDKRALELILNKLQKKDIYGVYAEPVDPEELPNYYDVIKHPMDFATVRNKLRSGWYETMEQFEHDIFLICSNAMRYNTPDTIYHKQARSIKELAVKKFHEIRLNAECLEKDFKPDQKMRSTATLKKSVMRSVRETVQEPLDTDFSSVASLFTAVDMHHVSNVPQAVGFHRPGSDDLLVEGNSFLNDNLHMREESRIGKCPLPKFGAELLEQDENRRATYNSSLSYLVESSESVFSTFEGDDKQLVPVGLYSDNSYARSLARFSATLGSVALKVASKKIEQALPQGFKFSQGLVEEYLSLPTPVLKLENCTVKEPPFLAKVQPVADHRKFENVPMVTFPSRESRGTEPVLGNNVPSSPSIIVSQAFKETSRWGVSEKPSHFLSPKPRGSDNLRNHCQKSRFRTSVESDKNIFKQFELNGSPSFCKKADEPRECTQVSRHSELEASKSMEFTSRNITFSPVDNKGFSAEGLPNGEVFFNRFDANIASSSPNLETRSYNPYEQGKGLLDNPVQFMSYDSNLAALYAAQAWMSVGEGVFGNTNQHKNQINFDSLCNSTHDIQPQVAQFPTEFPSGGMHVRPDRISSPFYAFAPQEQTPARLGSESQFHYEPTVYPQLAGADMSRFPMHSTWCNLNPQMSSKQRLESIPPSLNIDFQSSLFSGAGRPSSLTLQLRHFI